MVKAQMALGTRVPDQSAGLTKNIDCLDQKSLTYKNTININWSRRSIFLASSSVGLGAIVGKVATDSMAFVGGVEVGDRVIAIGEQSVSVNTHWRNCVRRWSPRFRIWHRSIRVSITVGQRGKPKRGGMARLRCE